MQNMDIVYSLGGLWLFYTVAMILASVAHRRELSKSWYDPKRFVQEQMSLGFIQDVMDDPDKVPDISEKDRSHPATSIMRQKKKGKPTDAKKQAGSTWMGHGISLTQELKEEHEWLSICFSNDIYVSNPRVQHRALRSHDF